MFVTGDIHTFVAGDVRVDNGDSGRWRASSSPARSRRRGWARTGRHPADRRPVQPEDARGDHRPAPVEQPVAVGAEFDHHGYGLVEATQKSFSCKLRRVSTVKTDSRKALPDKRFSYRITRGHPSLLD